MLCLIRHQWVYDLRFYHVHRKCSVCSTVQRHVWNKESAYSEWESIRERTYIESEQKQIVRKPVTPFLRIAHALRLVRTRARDRRPSLARPVRP